ncbi:MAG: response regulator of RpoS [Mucilaginibacter sp.]|jgi:PAS domain S-box-containing protein|nr:response regulator of RpoS [Mucilaginibacter sp.]
MLTDNRPYNILVIEDNPGDFVLIEDFLLEQNKSLKILHAKNFKSAKEILTLQTRLVDVVLLDLSLPDKTGEALIVEIVALCAAIPAIVLTGYTDVAFGARSLALGVSDYILKDDLTSTILYKSIIYSLERKRITWALEESEKRYSELFHLSPLPIFVFDIETLRFLNVNKSAIQHYGYSREEFLGMTIRDIRPVEDISDAEEALITSQYKNQFILKGNYRNKTKNGKIIQVEIQCNTINYKGRKARVILVIDITERLNYINAIEAQNEKLHQISWIQSHMVRAPLARILGIIPILKEARENESDIRKLLNYLEVSANELDRVIKEISDKVDVPEDFVLP